MEFPGKVVFQYNWTHTQMERHAKRKAGVPTNFTAEDLIIDKGTDNFHDIIDLLVLKLEYSRRSIPWLLMPWVIMSPGPHFNIKTVFPGMRISIIKTRYVDGTPTSEVTPVIIWYIRPPHHGHTSQYHGLEWMTHILFVPCQSAAPFLR